MATMKISELLARLAVMEREHGDIGVVLWDLDTGAYFSLTPENIELQRMADRSVRASIGLNYWGDKTELPPAERSPL